MHVGGEFRKHLSCSFSDMIIIYDMMLFFILLLLIAAQYNRIVSELKICKILFTY